MELLLIMRTIAFKVLLFSMATVILTSCASSPEGVVEVAGVSPGAATCHNKTREIVADHAVTPKPGQIVALFVSVPEFTSDYVIQTLYKGADISGEYLYDYGSRSTRGEIRNAYFPDISVLEGVLGFNIESDQFVHDRTCYYLSVSGENWRRVHMLDTASLSETPADLTEVIRRLQEQGNEIMRSERKDLGL